MAGKARDKSGPKRKTERTEGDVEAFLAGVSDAGKRADAETVCAMMARVTGDPPRMWGSSIVGFGDYRYINGSGKEVGWFLCGFSPRKTALTLYIMPGFSEFADLMPRLGPHKTGRSCLYLKRLSDVDPDVLEELVATSVTIMKEKYAV